MKIVPAVIVKKVKNLPRWQQTLLGAISGVAVFFGAKGLWNLRK